MTSQHSLQRFRHLRVKHVILSVFGNNLPLSILMLGVLQRSSKQLPNLLGPRSNEQRRMGESIEKVSSKSNNTELSTIIFPTGSTV